MQRFLYAVLCTLCATSAYAQTYPVSGSVKDNAGAAVPTATVTLLLVADSSWVQSELTDEQGKYLFEKIASGKYIMDVQALGFDNKKFPVEVGDKAIAFEATIDKQANNLEEVTVTATKPFIENTVGKMIVNVGSSAVGIGSNALDLLRKSPGVTVGENGSISIQGKQGVVVLINERPTYLEGEELADYLRSLSSDDIASIELITQPSAKYDAESSAGIINFVQKKNKKEGFNGNATASIGQGVYPHGNGNFNLTYKKKKLNSYLSGSGRKAVGFARRWHERDILDDNGNIAGEVDGETFLKEVFSDVLVRTGADYDATGKTTVGVFVSGNYHPNTEVDIATDLIRNPATGNTITNNSVHQQGFLRKRVLANAYVKNTIDDKNSITTNADYTYSFSKSRQYLNAQNTDNDGNKVSEDLNIRSWVPFTIQAYSLKSDYSGDVTKNIKIEAGVKTAYAVTDNNAMFDKYENDDWVVDNGRTNHFTYKENINAAYVSMNATVNDKCKLQGGLRAEQANIEGYQEVNDQSFERNTLSLFPTAYVSYTLDKKNELQLNFGKRIERPSYNWLNPFPNYTSQYHYETGNPDLKPLIAHEVELSHVYDGKLTTKCSYTHEENMINGVPHKSNIPNVTYQMGENIASINTGSMSVSMYRKLLSWWEISVMGYGFYSDYHDELADERRYGHGYGAHIDSQFSFKNGWKANVQMNYMGRTQEGVYAVMKPAMYNSFNVSKKLFKDSGTISLNVEDPFFVYRYNWEVDNDAVRATGSTKHNTMSVDLSFKYNFGRNTGAKARDNVSDEAKRM
jgi:hypothetical protein